MTTEPTGLSRRTAIRLVFVSLFGAGLIALVAWFFNRTDELATLRGHAGPVRAVVISPDGSFAASAGDDGTVRIWDAASNRERSALQHGGKVQAVAVAPDGRVVSVGDDAVARIWKNGEAAGTRHGAKKSLECVAASNDFIAAAGVEGTVFIWSAKQDGPPRSLTGHLRHVHAMLFTPDGKTLITGGEDGNLRFWDASSGTLLGNLPPDKRHIHSLAVSPDGTRLYAAVTGKGVKRWSLPDRKELPPIEAAGSVRGVAVSPDGRTLATVHEDGGVKLWDAESGAPLRSLSGHKRVVLSAAFAPDGTVFTSDGEGFVKRWPGE